MTINYVELGHEAYWVIRRALERAFKGQVVETGDIWSPVYTVSHKGFTCTLNDRGFLITHEGSTELYVEFGSADCLLGAVTAVTLIDVITSARVTEDEVLEALHEGKEE